LASPLLQIGDLDNPNVVKVVRDVNERAIYFSRAAIPYARESVNRAMAAQTALHHHGIYAYRCGVLRQLVSAAPSDLEICERLEQLRAMSLGMAIAVGVPPQRPGAGVDTEADLLRVAQELQK
jgi:3-deoxy-manno-octulosonate cytidylyltransferase (CMP-KDO synthetase)